MKKTLDKLQGKNLEAKKPTRKECGAERGAEKGKKGRTEKIRGGVKAKVGAVVLKTETRAVLADVRRGGRGPKRQKNKSPKPAVSAEGLQDTETAGTTVVDASVAAAPAATPAAVDTQAAELAQKQEFEKFARQLYTSEQITELEQLGIPLDSAGSYVFVTEKNPDGTLSKYRFWTPKSVRFFIDNKISAERVNFYSHKIYSFEPDACTVENITEWVKHPELTIDIILRRPNSFPANLVKFFADFSTKHPEFTWADIPNYPMVFTPDDVAYLVYAGIKPIDAPKHVELFSTERRNIDLFNAEQLKQLQQGIVPPEVRVAYDRGDFSWTDKAILYFAEHRAKPALVASYPKEFTAEDRIYCIEHFVIVADIARYPQWTQEYESKITVKRVCFLVRHNADPVFSRQVFEKYREKFSRHSNFNASMWAWNNLQQLIEEKALLEYALRYIENFFIEAKYVILFIKRGVLPETVNDYLSKGVGKTRSSDNINYNFICGCAAAGMTADEAKPYWDSGFEHAVAIDLWRGHVEADAAKPYKEFYLISKDEYGNGQQLEHTASGAEIVRYVNENVSPGVAALLRKADFTDDELSEAVAKIQRQKTRSKVFKIFAVIAALAAAAGIAYKACAGDDVPEKKPEGQARPTATGPAELGREKPEQQIRIPTSLCRFDFIPPKRVDLSCTTNYSVPIPIGNLVIDGKDKSGARTMMKAHATGVVYTDGVTYDCEKADFFMPDNYPDRGQLLDPVYDHMVCEPQKTRK